MTVDPFESDQQKDVPWDGDERRLVVDLDGYEGPLDMLLALARQQKVDLARISILQLANQYVDYIERAHQLDLDIAADHLVMAAWLAYLKSRLLLPAPTGDEEPTGEALAAALSFQLRRLEAMRAAGEKVMALPRLGRDVFARGAPEGLRLVRNPVFEATLYELLVGYAGYKIRTRAGRLNVEPSRIESMDQALQRLTGMLSKSVDWTRLAGFLPPGLANDLIGRATVAATFAACLELTRLGRVRLRQAKPFAPLYLRSVAKS
ncbi:MAG: segregation/condensation protein A [Proteobacteria bacterium]|nr:segregation/condensation protein A [Pseudomonadota bacterium]